MAGNYSPLRDPADSRGRVRTLTTTQVYTFSKYSKATQLPAGEALRSKPFDFHGRSWRIKVYPAGFSPETRDFVAVFVKCRTEPLDHFDASDVTIEILDRAGENTVFDDATAKSTLTIGDGGFSRGYARFARRRELEASSCVHNDSFRIRCTLVVDARVPKPSMFPWRRTTKVDNNDMMVPTPSSLIKTFAPDSAAGMDIVSASGPEVVTGSYTLTISCFSEKKASLSCGECVRSVQFSVGGSNWYIKVYPNGHDDLTRDSVTFFLARGKSREPETTVEFAFELVNFEEVGNHKSAKLRQTFDDRANSEHLGFQRVAADLQSARQMSNDRLIVRCKLGVFKGKPPCPLLAEVPAVAVPPYDHSAGFLWLLKSQEGSDVTFAVGDTTFRAHSCILAAQSPVLRAEVRALAEDPERAWRYIEVQDEEITAEAFEALLHVAYTDHLPDMSYVEPTDERVEALLFAAERYELKRLKVRCEEWVSTFVTVCTVVDILSMAVRLDCQLLKAACVEYATPDHVWDLLKGTDGFERLKATCPEIVRQIESKQRKY